MLTSTRFIVKEATRSLARHSTSGSVKTTQYSPEVAARYERATKDLRHWSNDGFQCTILSQLDKLNRSSVSHPEKVKVIDLACGDGNYSRAMSDRFGYGHIVGVDKSESQLALAKQKTQSDAYPNISYYQLDIGTETALDVEALGGPFDVALPIFLYNYAESKKELFDMIQWTNSLLKPGGTVIGCNPAIRNLSDADNGIYKNDPKFCYQQIFGDEVKEGKYLTKLGDVHGDDTMNLESHLYTYNTYETVFEISGFSGVRFLEGDDYLNDKITNSTEEERMMFLEFMTWKGCALRVFTATKN